ncbi:RNB domain-containing ribonuclease [Actinomycetes bacterium M1A6_2h]
MRRLVAGDMSFDRIRAEFDIPNTYPADAVTDALAAVDSHATGRRDATDLAFVTIDPPGSMDLDQALLVTRTPDGFRLHYAIADVAAVVLPGGALDAETRRRGQTVYLPDGSVPLHPLELSEGSASLLPDTTRPVALWTVELDSRGDAVSWTVERALVRSTRRFTYAEVQQSVDAGAVHPSLEPLPDLGRLRIARALDRGAIELKLPEQEVVADGAGWRVEQAPRTDVDDWNAEMSLLTGMCAAAMMIDARVGLLRTLPPPAEHDVDALRRVAKALGIEWPAGMEPGALLATLDPARPATLAMMTEATRLLRGADYVAFDGAVPEQPNHSGIGGPYAHVTAPLRRLVDRFATEICLSIASQTAVPTWVTDAMPTLPEDMRRSDSIANKVDRACVDLTESVVLAPSVGETFDAAVLRGKEGKRSAQVFVAEPPVIADCSGDPAEGTRVRVRLDAADAATRTVRFSPA